VLSFRTIVSGELDILCCIRKIHWASVSVLSCTLWSTILYYIAAAYMSACLPASESKVLYAAYLQHPCAGTLLCAWVFFNFLTFYIFICSFPLSHLQHQSVTVSWMNIKSSSFFWPLKQIICKMCLQEASSPKDVSYCSFSRQTSMA